MTREELVARRGDLMRQKEDNAATLIDIKQQIELAKARAEASGQYADPSWWVSVNAAARHKGRRDQQLAREIGEIGRQIAAASGRSFEAAFLDAARERLPPETFDALLRCARSATVKVD